MSDPNAQNEPSMEEILASIRRIISEDETEGEGEAVETEAAEESGDDVLELTQLVEDDGTVVDLAAAKQEAAVEPAEEPEAQPEPVEEPELEVEAEPEMAPEQEPEPPFEAELEPVDLELEIAPEEVEIEAVAEQLPSPVEAPPPAPVEGLVSSATAMAATAAMANLTRLATDDRHSGMSTASALTVEALVRQAIEPHLKSWLDANLAPLVERVVREEVKKMARRAEDR